MPTYLTLSEAAARLGISRQMVARYVKQGRIKALPRLRERDPQYIAARDCRIPKPNKPGPKP